MPLGFVSAILPEQTLEELFHFAADAGYDCIELMCWPVSQAERRYAGVTHVDVVELTPAQADTLCRLAERVGVAISGLGYYPNPLDPDEQVSHRACEHLRRVMHAASLLGVACVNTFVGRDWRLSVDAQWERFQRVWGPLIDEAERLGLRIGIENCPMLFTQDEWPGGKNLATSPAIWRRMFTTFPSRAWGLNYDPSHFVWQQMDYLRPLREFADRLVHVHAKDVRVDRERLDEVGLLATPLEYHTPKLPGLGEIDWGRFCSVLGDSGYRGAICVEVEDRAYEGSLERRQAALRQSAAFLRNFIR